jgi:hypothetical protein
MKSNRGLCSADVPCYSVRQSREISLCGSVNLSMLEFDIADPAINLLPLFELPNVPPEKAPTQGTPVAHEQTRSHSVSMGFPNHKKHLVGLLSVWIDKTAWISAISDTDGASSTVLEARGASPLAWRPVNHDGKALMPLSSARAPKCSLPDQKWRNIHWYIETMI